MAAEDEHWKPPRPERGCRPGELHVWRVPLASGALAAAGEALLSDAEREVWRSYRFDHLRRAYAIRRGALRRALGALLAAEPREVSIATHASGKPFAPDARRLKFNVSHSADYALLAFTTDSEVGVDIEAVRTLPELMGMAEQFLAPEEHAWLRALPSAERGHAFLRIWTRKEAVLKAHGSGLRTPLNRFTVPTDHECHAVVRCLGEGDASASSWTVLSLPLGDGYVGALAVAQTAPRVLLWEEPPSDRKGPVTR